jgi:hypothetical protein
MNKNCFTTSCILKPAFPLRSLDHSSEILLLYTVQSCASSCYKLSKRVITFACMGMGNIWEEAKTRVIRRLRYTNQEGCSCYPSLATHKSRRLQLSGPPPHRLCVAAATATKSLTNLWGRNYANGNSYNPLLPVG